MLVLLCYWTREVTTGVGENVRWVGLTYMKLDYDRRFKVFLGHPLHQFTVEQVLMGTGLWTTVGETRKFVMQYQRPPNALFMLQEMHVDLSERGNFLMKSALTPNSEPRLVILATSHD